MSRAVQASLKLTLLLIKPRPFDFFSPQLFDCVFLDTGARGKIPKILSRPTSGFGNDLYFNPAFSGFLKCILKDFYPALLLNSLVDSFDFLGTYSESPQGCRSLYLAVNMSAGFFSLSLLCLDPICYICVGKLADVTENRDSSSYTEPEIPEMRRNVSMNQPINSSAEEMEEEESKLTL